MRAWRGLETDVGGGMSTLGGWAGHERSKTKELLQVQQYSTKCRPAWPSLPARWALWRQGRLLLNTTAGNLMLIQQVADQAQPDQLVVVGSLDVVVVPTLVQPGVDTCDWSWSVVRLVVHKLPVAYDLGRHPPQRTLAIGTFRGWRDVLVLG